jgi:hypothetical protein
MIKISDMLKNNSKKSLINEEQLLEKLEEMFVRKKYYKRIQDKIDKGLINNDNEVYICLSIRDIKKHLKPYLKSKETFTEKQLVSVIKQWAIEQDKTMESKFSWRFERDFYGDLYFDMWIGLNQNI